jgi:hypothetical protein
MPYCEHCNVSPGSIKVGNSSPAKRILSLRTLSKAVPLHAMEAFGGEGSIAPTHSLPRR